MSNRETPTSEFIEAGELRFEVATCGDPDADRLALCLHGFPESNFSWRHQMPVLARQGYRVWAPNLRGYGRTTRPQDKKAYRLDRLLEDVEALIDAAGKRETLLVAHDWGGILAWIVAIERLRPLEGLIVMNLPHPVRMAEELRTNRRQRRRSSYGWFFQLPRVPEWLLTRRGARAIGRVFRDMAIDKTRFPEQVLDHYRRNALEPGAMTAMINWYRGLPDSRARLEALAKRPRLQTRTLLVWGEEDSALGVELTLGTDAYVENLTVRYLPRVSHWVQQEAPEEVNAIVEAWLEERPVPGNAQPSDPDYQVST